MNEHYRLKMHQYGRIFMVFGLIVMFLAPVSMWLITGVAPDINRVFLGVLALWIFIPGGMIEMVTYSPILGTSATYLSFITGNLINLKVPCVMNASELCGTRVNTPENEVVATIAVAFSSITTVVILSVGVLMLVPLRPLLQSDVLAPAFNWVVSALFGALGYKYFKGNVKLVIAPMLIVTVLSIIMPKFVNGSITIMIPIMVVITVLITKVLYDKKIV